MTIEEYFGDWAMVIDLKEASRIMQRLVASKEPVCPKLNDVFRAFRLCPLSSLRCVIIGQDPYCNFLNDSPVVTGLAFANTPGTPYDCFSPSLKVLSDSVTDFSVPHHSVNFDPSLEKWEEQGILLLNAALSCAKGKPSSHTLLWRPFISPLLTNLLRCTCAVVYVLMGSSVQSLESFIGPNNHTIRCKHPAYYARKQEAMPSDI